MENKHSQAVPDKVLAAARNVAGAKAVHEELKERFPSVRRRQAEQE